MSKKLNTKKATQGFSTVKAAASKQAVTKLCRFYKTIDARQANAYAVNGVVYNVALASVALMDASKSKTLTTALKKAGGAIKLEAYGYKNNDYSALVKFGRDIQNKDHKKWLDVQSDGIGRLPQAVLKRLKDQNASPTNKATSDVDTWIKSICNGATKRGLSKAKFLQKLCDHLQVPVQIHKKTNIDNLGTFKTKTEKKLDKAANQ